MKDIFLTGVGEQGEDVDGKMVEEAFKMNKSESFEIILHRWWAWIEEMRLVDLSVVRVWLELRIFSTELLFLSVKLVNLK